MNINTYKDRLGLIVLLLYFFMCFGLMLMDSGAPQVTEDTKTINLLKIMQVLMSTVLFILPATLFCRFLREERSAFLNLNHLPRFYFVFASISAVLLSMPAVSGLEAFNTQMHLPQSFSAIEQWARAKEDSATQITLLFFVDKSWYGLVSNILVMAFVAALSEEIFFRGLLQQMLIKNKMNAHIAIALTAFLFSAFHLQFFGFIPRMLLGMVLGYLYYLTQNLWVSVIAHFCNNAFAVIAMHFYSEEVTSPKTPTTGLSAVLFILLSLALVIGQLLVLHRIIQKQKKEIS
ncbi:MAG: CPBP family intramembrane metalloprotease [Bacteroidetes bacterium]|nr:CPBP family intramembrane metalloprotease [Bacteroidota bacterium]